MNNKEQWLEIKLTDDVLNYLSGENIISDRDAQYILTLHQVIKVIGDNKDNVRYYITNVSKDLPNSVLELYKHIYSNQLAKLLTLI